MVVHLVNQIHDVSKVSPFFAISMDTRTEYTMSNDLEHLEGSSIFPSFVCDLWNNDNEFDNV